MEKSDIYEAVARLIGYKRFGLLRKMRLKSRSYFLDVDELVYNKKIDERIRTWEEWNILRSTHVDKVFKEKVYKQVLSKDTRIIIPGECSMCGAKHGFIGFISDNDIINHRESFACVSCSRLRRERVIIEKIRNLYKSGKKDIYIYETGANYRFIKKFARNAVGSEYLSPEYNSGDIIKGVLHEDANNLSFGDESFDVVVSRDVFEHLNDPVQCFKEAYRVLKPGGVCIVSIPWNSEARFSDRRARITNGEVENILPPKYHWNPVTKKSDSFVFWDYGWDFLDYMKEGGFEDAYIQAYYDDKKGYLGNIGTYFVAIKQ